MKWQCEGTYIYTMFNTTVFPNFQGLQGVREEGTMWERRHGQKCLLHTNIGTGNAITHTWFQHNGASFSVYTCRDKSPGYSISWSTDWYGDVVWSTKSPDLALLDFFIWSNLQSLIYKTSMETEEHLVARILAVCENVQNIPGTFKGYVRTWCASPQCLQ